MYNRSKAFYPIKKEARIEIFASLCQTPILEVVWVYARFSVSERDVIGYHKISFLSFFLYPNCTDFYRGGNA